ncbi:MAG: SMC-Scp complex subunit ScpB [Clostridia bacterium]|nr:SMC-Scp complex subunit ScpB [Clostridia bacterium]
MSLKEITRIIEGVLFVAGEGIDIDVFKTKFDMNDREFNKCIDILKERYNEETGINIIRFKNKVQLSSNPVIVNEISEILNPIRERSLTRAALETIAIIAYKQPITRSEIEDVRGVNCDYAIQLLQNNNLIEIVGRKDAVGKPVLFGTTENFLKRFEINNIEDLPNYNELLDRIRVIHSEGESLYREFTIPEEEPENKEQETQNSQENNLPTDEHTEE